MLNMLFFYPFNIFAGLGIYFYYFTLINKKWHIHKGAGFNSSLLKSAGCGIPSRRVHNR